MAAHFFGINDRVYSYSHTIGVNANAGSPGFNSPTDLAVGRNGIIYVVNRSFEGWGGEGLARVRGSMVTMDEEYLGSFGRRGEGDGEFIWPACIALDSQDNIYVTDNWLNRVVVFDKTGNYLRKFGESGSKPGQMIRPLGIAFDANDHLYLVDGHNHRIEVFDWNGVLLTTFGSFGTRDGQLNFPWGIAVDRQGRVYVADWRNDRVQVFDREGKYLAKFGSSGDLVGQFNRPTDIAVDQDGDIYVVDWLNHRVQAFTPEFRNITIFLGDATMSKWGEHAMRSLPPMQQMLGLIRDWTPFQRFRYPIAVAADSQGRVLIVDGAFQRLQVYQKERVGVGAR